MSSLFDVVAAMTAPDYDSQMVKAIPQGNQRTPEWYEARRGKFTSSEIWKLVTEPRSKAAKEAGELSQTAESYIMEVYAEIITGVSADSSSASMQWGIDHEDAAKQVYTSRTNKEIIPCSFIEFNQFTGGSPDGLIAETGMIEIKCPYNSGVHAKNLINSKNTALDFKANYKEYYWQVQSNLMVTGRAWCDFVSYDPRFPEKMNLAIIKVHRNEYDITGVLIPALSRAIFEIQKLLANEPGN